MTLIGDILFGDGYQVVLCHPQIETHLIGLLASFVPRIFSSHLDFFAPFGRHTPLEVDGGWTLDFEVHVVGEFFGKVEGFLFAWGLE